MAIKPTPLTIEQKLRRDMAGYKRRLAIERSFVLDKYEPQDSLAVEDVLDWISKTEARTRLGQPFQTGRVSNSDGSAGMVQITKANIGQFVGRMFLFEHQALKDARNRCALKAAEKLARLDATIKKLSTPPSEPS